MARLGRMHEEGRRAGGGEGGGDLGADVPALAHAGHDDAALGVVDHPAGAVEGLAHLPRQGFFQGDQAGRLDAERSDGGAKLRDRMRFSSLARRHALSFDARLARVRTKGEGPNRGGKSLLTIHLYVSL